MKAVYARCAGLDIHKRSVSVCIRRGKGKNMEQVTAVFETFTEDLERLAQFLRRHRVQRVVMESTGVYWIPIWNVLERGADAFDILLVNPQHVRALPGRKTDQQDSERLAELGQYDLLRGSFIPPLAVRQLRDLTRRRCHLQGDRTRAINRIGRLLEKANLKLSSVASHITGKTGTLVLRALASGQDDPGQLAKLAQGRLKLKQVDLARALDGFPDGHFRWLLGELLDELQRLDRKLAELDARLRQYVQPWADVVGRLCTIPGVQETVAWTLLAELGTDMQPFPDAAHAASWAGLCPGNCQSAGKRHSGRTRKGNSYLRRMLVQSAWTITHKKDCFLTALFYRLAARRGLKKAALAVAHRILIIAYYVIRDGEQYRETGGDYFDRLHPERTAQRLTRRLQRIGFDVTVTPRPASSAPLPVSPALSPAISGRRRRGCKCAKWGISCIHLRNATPSAPVHPPPSSSTT